MIYKTAVQTHVKYFVTAAAGGRIANTDKTKTFKRLNAKMCLRNQTASTKLLGRYETAGLRAKRVLEIYEI